MSKWLLIAIAIASPVVVSAPALADDPSHEGSSHKAISDSDKSFKSPVWRMIKNVTEP